MAGPSWQPTSSAPRGPRNDARGRGSLRRRRGGRAVTLLAATCALVLVGAWGVRTVLDRQDSTAPVVEACRATYRGTSWELSPERSSFAALVAVRALARGMPARAATIAIATAYQESTILNLDHGDRDSFGLFQQRPSQGWGTKAEVRDPVHATESFYTALAKVPGYRDMSVTDAAQAVQRSGFPEAYADHEDLGRAWASALHGYSAANLTCTLAPVVLDEDGSFDDGLAKADRGSAPAAPLTVFERRVARDLPELGTTLRTQGSQASDPDSTGAVALPTVRIDAVEAAQVLGQGTGAPTADRTAWALGQWAVAVAAQTGAQSVDVTTREGTLRWSRGTEGWHPVSSGAEAGVTVTFPAGPSS